MTAVEWLINWVNTNQYVISNELLEAFEKAKEMEWKQLVDAHGEDRSYLQDDGSWKRINGEQYYNETYGSQGSSDTTSPDIKNK
jgi:hypothetical protein